MENYGYNLKKNYKRLLLVIGTEGNRERIQKEKLTTFLRHPLQ